MCGVVRRLPPLTLGGSNGTHTPSASHNTVDDAEDFTFAAGRMYADILSGQVEGG